MIKNEEELKKILTPEEYKVMCEKGTEQPFTGIYWDSKDKGVYKCKICGNELFSSDTKFESGTGWPSFFAPITEKSVKMIPDNAYGMNRTEVVCGKCGAHLGHVFKDGPKPTGERFCVNSASLKLQKEEKN